MALGPGSAVSLVQNSRGVLLHAVKITDGVIEKYHILTPTEINVVDCEWFKKTLLNLKARNAEELKKLAELTILSMKVWAIKRWHRLSNMPAPLADAAQACLPLIP